MCDINYKFYHKLAACVKVVVSNFYPSNKKKNWSILNNHYGKIERKHRFKIFIKYFKYILCIFILEGTTEKVLQFKIPLKSIYNRNLGFDEQKMYFWTLQRGSNNKNSIILLYFCHNFQRCAPYRPMLVYNNLFFSIV